MTPVLNFWHNIRYIFGATAVTDISLSPLYVRGPEMALKTALNPRDRLAFLALYYAIKGNDKRSEQLRRAVRRHDQAVLGRPQIDGMPMAF